MCRLCKHNSVLKRLWLNDIQSFRFIHFQNKLLKSRRRFSFLALSPLFVPSPSSCSSSGTKAYETSFSFSWGTWFGSLGSEPRPSSPSLLWWFPQFLRCSRSAWTPRCSDPPPSLTGGPSRWVLSLSTDETKSVKADKRCDHTDKAVITGQTSHYVTGISCHFTTYIRIKTQTSPFRLNWHLQGTYQHDTLTVLVNQMIFAKLPPN